MTRSVAPPPLGAIFPLAAAGLLLAVASGTISLPDLGEPLGVWIHLAVPALVFLETMLLVGFVIHGELVLMLSGVAAARGDASLAVLIGLAWAAVVAGDLAGVGLGRGLGRPFLERHVGLARVEGFFERHGAKALFLGRFTGFLRSTMPFAVGSAGVSVRRLVPVSAASGLVWTATFTLIGYALAESFASAGQTATRIASGAIVLAIAAFALQGRRRLPAAGLRQCRS